MKKRIRKICLDGFLTGYLFHPVKELTNYTRKVIRKNAWSRSLIILSASAVNRLRTKKSHGAKFNPLQSKVQQQVYAQQSDHRELSPTLFARPVLLRLGNLCRLVLGQ